MKWRNSVNRRILSATLLSRLGVFSSISTIFDSILKAMAINKKNYTNFILFFLFLLLLSLYFVDVVVTEITQK